MKPRCLPFEGFSDLTRLIVNNAIDQATIHQTHAGYRAPWVHWFLSLHPPKIEICHGEKAFLQGGEKFDARNLSGQLKKVSFQQTRHKTLRCAREVARPQCMALTFF
jgi:hypothetical protein